MAFLLWGIIYSYAFSIFLLGGISFSYWFVSTLHILCETLIKVLVKISRLSFYIDFFFQIKVFTFIDSLIAYMFRKAYPIM